MDGFLDTVNVHGWKFAVVFFLLTKIYEVVWGETKKKLKIIEQCALACQQLKVHVSYLRNDILRLPKMEKDINLAFHEIRQMRDLSVGGQPKRNAKKKGNNRRNNPNLRRRVL